MSDIDTSRTDDIVCPYCGHEHGDSWEFDLSGSGIVECNKCEREFKAAREIEVYYWSEEIEGNTHD